MADKNIRQRSGGKSGKSMSRAKGKKQRSRSPGSGKRTLPSKPKVKKLTTSAGNDQHLLRSLIWAGIFTTLLLTLLGASIVSQIDLWKISIIVLVGSITAPMQMLLLTNSYFLVAFRPSASEFAGFLCLLGVSLGLALIVNAKYAPLPLVRLLTGMASRITFAYHLVLDVVPLPIMEFIGVGYTLISELLLVPAVIFLLLGVAQLKYAGEDFNRHDRSRDSGQQKRVLIVFIHGNKFNEAQWLFGRLLLLARPWSAKVDFISINIFRGIMMRNHSEETLTIAGCAKRAMEEIRKQIRLHNVQPDHVLVMGHSLGGVLAAYLKEHMSEEPGFPIERVVTWSAPLGGSHLLLWAKQTLPSVEFLNTNENITLEFCPTNPVTRDLLKRMQRTETVSPTYFAVTGWCDPLVRPRSALPAFLRMGNSRMFPYLGHYNIKISLNAWRQVIAFVDEYMHELGMF